MNIASGIDVCILEEFGNNISSGIYRALAHSVHSSGNRNVSGSFNGCILNNSPHLHITVGLNRKACLHITEYTNISRIFYISRGSINITYLIYIGNKNLTFHKGRMPVNGRENRKLVLGQIYISPILKSKLLNFRRRENIPGHIKSRLSCHFLGKGCKFITFFNNTDGRKREKINRSVIV